MKFKRRPVRAYQPPLARLAEELRYAAINISRRNARERAARMADIIPPAHVERGGSFRGELAKHARAHMRALPEWPESGFAEAAHHAREIADGLTSPLTLVSEWCLGRKRRFDEHEFRRA